MKENIKRDSAIDLFNSILKTARDAGALQELDRIIDYDSACEFEEKNKRPISNYEFNCIFSVDYGGSEGIYIDAWLNGYLDESGHTQRLHFGTIKTLERDLAAMKIMGEACGILQYYASDYPIRIFPAMNPIRRNCRCSIIRIRHSGAVPANQWGISPY